MLNFTWHGWQDVTVGSGLDLYASAGGGGNSSGGGSWKQTAGCFVKGAVVGAVGAVAVGAVAVGAVSLGAPVAVVTEVLAGAAVVGGAAIAYGQKSQTH
jgi:hypothetical protein